MQDKSLSEVHQSVQVGKHKNFFRTLYAFIGPAYLVSVGYMDPGNWATDIAGGSQFGYQLIWVLLMSNLMALLLQGLAARLGVVKGWDLAQASRQQYPSWVNIPLYILAEIAIAACDLAEIIGMAIGLYLLFDIPLVIGILITAFDTLLLLLLLNKGIRKMEAFIVSLVSIIGISFLVNMIIVEPEWKQVAHNLVPSALSSQALYIAIGIIGATVMPHNLYLHSALVQTRKFSRDNEGIRKAIRFNFIDSAVALNLAFFVNSAILILAASAFYRYGHYEVANIEDAHVLLKDIFGNMAPTLFAIALIAAGQSSTITGTLAGQIVMEGYLNLRISPWIRRMITRLIAIIPALFTIYYFGEDRLGNLLVLSQVVLSIQLGFAIIPLIHFVSSKKLMGDFKIGIKTKVLAWFAATIIIGLNIRLVYEELTHFFEYLGTGQTIIKMLILLIVLGALFLLTYIVFEPIINRRHRKKEALPHGTIHEISALEKPEYHHIAITVEFSEHDKKAIEHALRLGGKTATYLLIHIVESAVALRSGSDVLDLESQFDKEFLLSYQKDLINLGYKTEIELGYGKSASAIIAIINKQDIDLVVMGAHGHKGFKDFIFGSTVDKVRHRIKAPVFIVK
ncbi:MAG: Nramp family divalent metal transporter [Bacteroidia bacterium]|jgi:manganese transport protein